jgi:hypothetical protein
MTRVFVDENISPYLAEGLHILEKPNDDDIEVVSIESVFGRGIKDQDWIPQVGKEGGVVITQDLNIQRTQQLHQLYEKAGVGVFFFSAPSKGGFCYWDMVKQIVNRWIEMKKLCKKKRPFAYRCTSRKKDFEDWG